MKITYEFCNGDRNTVEVDEELGEFLMESRRLEENLERKERYHRGFSLDEYDFEGVDIAAAEDAEDMILQMELQEEILGMLDTLTNVQRRRLLMFANGLSTREIARRDGCDHEAAAKSIRQARGKINKLLPIVIA